MVMQSRNKPETILNPTTVMPGSDYIHFEEFQPDRHVTDKHSMLCLVMSCWMLASQTYRKIANRSLRGFTTQKV